MEEDLRELVAACVRAFPASGLTPDVVGAFCAKHKLRELEFRLAFAKHVALEFAYGEIGYGAGDCAINALADRVGIELSGLPLEIYQAFDSGEHRLGESSSVIPWQRHTLPAIMEILARERWLPRA